MTINNASQLIFVGIISNSIIGIYALMFCFMQSIFKAIDEFFNSRGFK